MSMTATKEEPMAGLIVTKNQWTAENGFDEAAVATMITQMRMITGKSSSRVSISCELTFTANDCAHGHSLSIPPAFDGAELDHKLSLILADHFNTCYANQQHTIAS